MARLTGQLDGCRVVFEPVDHPILTRVEQAGYGQRRRPGFGELLGDDVQGHVPNDRPLPRGSLPLQQTHMGCRNIEEFIVGLLSKLLLKKPSSHANRTFLAECLLSDMFELL